MIRGKSKDSNKKHLRTNAENENAVPSSIKVSEQEITSPTIIHDNMSNSLCCISLPGQSASSCCDVAVDVNSKILSKDDMRKEASPIDFGDGTAAGSCLLKGSGGHTEKKHEGGLMEHSLSAGPSVDDDCIEGEKSLSDICSKMLQGSDSVVCSQLSEVLDRDNMDSECPSVDGHCAEYERLLSDICTKMSQGPESAVFSEQLDHDNIDSECNDDFGDWRTYWDSFYSRNYFFNIRTQESTWEPPPGMEHLLFLDMGDEPKEMVADVAEMYVDSAVSFHYNEKLDSIDSQYNLGSVEESRKDDRSLDQPSNETLEGFGLAADNFNNSLTTTTLRCCSEPLNEPLEINKCIVETSVYALSDTQQQSALYVFFNSAPQFFFSY